MAASATPTREVLEARRGFKRVNGAIVFTSEARLYHIARLEQKLKDLKERIPALEARIKELKAQK